MAAGSVRQVDATSLSWQVKGHWSGFFPVVLPAVVSGLVWVQAASRSALLSRNALDFIAFDADLTSGSVESDSTVAHAAWTL